MNNYNGTFNWHGEVFDLHTKAKSEGQAKCNMLYQLSLLVDRPLGIVRRVFNDSQVDNFKIMGAE